nr:hypothetical protein [Tanacetum cinerariifolium]
DSDGISKSPDCVDVSTDTLPIVTSQTKEIVTKSSIRQSKCSPDDLRSSGASPKGDDATLYKDEYVSQGEDFVDFNQLLEYNQIIIQRDQFLGDLVDNIKYLLENYVFSNNLNKIHEPKSYVLQVILDGLRP